MFVKMTLDEFVAFLLWKARHRKYTLQEFIRTTPPKYRKYLEV